MVPVALGTVSTVDAVAHALRQRILDGSLPPGTFIREIQVAADYGVARHTVRAATQQLVQEGLVRHAPNRGVHVPELNADDVVDIFRLRSALESEAVRLLISAASAPIAAAEGADRLDALPDDATWDQVVEADLAFHSGVIQDTGSQRLVRAYGAAQSEIQLCMVQLRPHYEHPSDVAAEHRILLDTLLARDLEAADREFRKHWEDATDNLLRTLAAAKRTHT